MPKRATAPDKAAAASGARADGAGGDSALPTAAAAGVRCVNFQAHASDGKSVAAKLETPAHAGARCCIGILLGHGASGNMEAAPMRAYAVGLVQRNVGCVVSYNATSTSVPHRCLQAKAVLQAAAAREECRHITHWVLAGHSMGARVAVQVAHELTAARGVDQSGPPRKAQKGGKQQQPQNQRRKPAPPGGVAAGVASGVAAEGGAAAGVGQGAAPLRAAGCLLLSYPLHPPDKTQALRDIPLVDLQLPMLFIRGTKDPFSSDGPFKALLPRLQSHNVQVHEVEGAGHTLFQPRKGKGSVPGSAGGEGVAGALENEPGRGEAAAGGEQGRVGREATKALGKRKRGAGGQGTGEGGTEAALGAEISGGRGRKKGRVTGGDDATDEGALVPAAVASQGTQGGGSVASSGDPKFDAVLGAAAAFCLSLA